MDQVSTFLGKHKSSTIPADVKQKKLASFFSKRTVDVQFNKDDIIRGIVHIVTVDGRPFNILNDTGFKVLMEPVLKALNSHINVHNITGYDCEYSSNIRNKIRTAVNRSLVSVKLDCVTRLDRSFLGINIQTIQNGEFMIYSLSAVEIKV